MLLVSLRFVSYVRSFSLLPFLFCAIQGNAMHALCVFILHSGNGWVWHGAI